MKAKTKKKEERFKWRITRKKMYGGKINVWIRKKKKEKYSNKCAKKNSWTSDRNVERVGLGSKKTFVICEVWQRKMPMKENKFRWKKYCVKMHDANVLLLSTKEVTMFIRRRGIKRINKKHIKVGKEIYKKKTSKNAVLNIFCLYLKWEKHVSRSKFLSAK